MPVFEKQDWEYFFRREGIKNKDNSIPNASPHGYQFISELGHNRDGGRITWLASNLSQEQQVVLKQFCFAQVNSNWSAFNAHEREIQVLRQLSHPGIARYLNAFETLDGFCLVQEYKNAPTLAVQHHFEPEKIKQIAVKVLEILVYLQNRNLPVIHRDIKPENILVDNQLNVYLIDFGMSRLGSQEISGSSVNKGTPGFIPPEQMRQPTLASDLYGLGATLICLLTSIKSTAIQDLTDNNDPYQINFRHLLPRLSLHFLNWLELMVKPKPNERFPNAQTALDALRPLDVIRVPGIELSQSALEFQATHLGEKLTQAVTIENRIPDTMLKGTWEVTPHLQDPPHTPDTHAWISVKPSKFDGNNTVCHVQVDTSNLMADKSYKRQLLLHTNAYPEIHPLAVRVQTAPLPIEKRDVPYARLTGLLCICGIASTAMTWFITVAGLWAVIKSMVGAAIGVFGGAAIVTLGGGMIWSITLLPLMMLFGYEDMSLVVIVSQIGVAIGAVGGLMTGAVMGITGVMNIEAVMRIGAVEKIGIGIGIWIIVVALTAWWAKEIPCDGYTERWDRKRRLDKYKSVLSILVVGLGTSFGIACIVGFLNPYILFALAGTGLPLAIILLYPSLKRRRLISKYRQSEERLIKP